MKKKRKVPPSAKAFQRRDAQRGQTRLKATACGCKVKPAIVRRL